MNVGEEAELRPYIESDYGKVCLVKGVGHDGRFTYLLARDPLLATKAARIIAQTGESASYRARRILMSVLGGGFGTFGPYTTLWGLIIVGALGVGLSAFAIAYAMALGNHSPLVLLAVFLNAGIISSLITLTADHLAIGFALLGTVFGLSGRRVFAMIAFGLAGLTKEIYLLPAISLFLIDARRYTLRSSALFLCGAALPLLLWLWYLRVVIPNDPMFAVGSNIEAPFSGLLESIPAWINLQSGQDKLFHAVSILCIAAASYFTVRLRSFTLAALVTPWLVLFVFMGSIVWDVGNNTARACATITALLGLIPMIRSLETLGERRISS